MQVSRNVLEKKYIDNVHNQQQVDMDHGARASYLPQNPVDSYIHQDVFVKSEYLQKLESLGDYIQGGFRDAQSFMDMANALQGESILNSQDLIAANYVARVSEDINFDEFNKIIQNENLSMEMRGLITQLMNKLYNIDYVHAGLLMAS